MERDGRLSIIILTQYKNRGTEVLDSIVWQERFKFALKHEKALGVLYSGDAVYRIVSTARPETWQGHSADQVIVDMLGDNYKIAKQILARSCVPEAYQIIDDRDIL